jgi:ABC-type antimicrobial peptide transport system permease subunit
MYFQLRTSVDPLSVVATARHAVASVDATLPVSEIRTQDQLIRSATTNERTFAILGTFFSSVAVLLACIGIYGVLAYAVSRRTPEFGIRLALGATGGQVRWLVLRGTIVLIVIAITIGVPSALAATKLIKSTLYGVEPNDAITIAAAAIAVIASALLAAWIPAHRAAKSDPAIALRYE